jgi:phage protein D
MSANERLVPVCIIYVDGVRLDTVCEGAFRSVKVFDLLNKVGQCTVTFDCMRGVRSTPRQIPYPNSNPWVADWQDLVGKTPKCFPFYASFSVHLGYKDNLTEVFSGEITRRHILHPMYGPSQFSVTASSLLWRMNNGLHKRAFEHKTPSQAITALLERYNLKAHCDSFGPSKGHWEGGAVTDWKLILSLAKRYGKDIYCFGNKVFVKEQMTMHTDEHIYEWGKSLISFRVKENTNRLAGKVRAIGWNTMQAKGFKTVKTLDDLSQKIGGRSPWTRLFKGSENWIDNVFDHSFADEREAGEFALGLLREQSFKFMRAEGKGEGNPKLTSGAMVMMKGLNAAWNGEYIAEAVVHDFSLAEGYITEFYLKRNMLDDEFVKKQLGGTGNTGAGRYAAASSQAGEEDKTEEEDKEEEKEGPEFRNLMWRKDGSKVSEALIDDEVTLFCEVKNIAEGETVKFHIWEHDEDGDHDDIGKLTGEVKESVPCPSFAACKRT